jgi:alpha-beta hydrolase superfamily lysophospholipase
VVICNTIGFEGQVAYRALRFLAEDLASQSFTVLRFDYPGSGDSEGRGAQAGNVIAMRQGLHAAVAAMRGWGASEVYLAGIRVGAALAARYALDDGDIAGLALWAPCVSGSGVVRELRARYRLSANRRPAQKAPNDDLPEGSLNVAGFQFSAAALESLASLRILDETERAATRRVLVIDRQDAAPSTNLVERLQESGAAVEHHLAGGWVDFMVEDETTSVLPTDSLNHITRWFARLTPDAEATSSRHSPSPPISHTLLLETQGDRGAIREEAVRLDNDLFGIKSLPVGPTMSSDRHGVLLLNTGMINRTGPAGLYVNLARHLSALGLKVLRVDLGGTGDTSRSSDLPGSHYLPDRTEEACRAVTWARQTMNVDRITLLGVCSGAFHAFQAALQDAGVDQIVLVNPAVFYLGEDGRLDSAIGNAIGRAYGMKRLLVSPTAWLRVRDREALWSKTPTALKGIAHMGLARTRNVMLRVGLRKPRQSGLAADLVTLTNRGVRILFLFAPEESALNYLRAFGGPTLATLERHGAVLIRELPEGDHLFSERNSRTALMGVVTEFLKPSPAESASAIAGPASNTIGDLLRTMRRGRRTRCL